MGFTHRQLFQKFMAPTSDAPLALEITKAEGVYLLDSAGKSYMDLISGIAVSNVGHCNPAVVKAIKDQVDHYMHLMVYGEYIQSPQVKLAEALVTYTGTNTLNQVYFTNSGTEAVEGAMKLAKRVTKRTKMVSFQGAYHGSTQGALSMMGDEYFKNAYRPLLPDTLQLRYNHFEDLDLIDHSVAGVLVELVQAETGVTPANKEWIIALQKKCASVCALLIVDEIQSGFGRTGSLFVFEQYGIVPDVLLTGKALGGGLPLGAFISSFKMMQCLTYAPVLGHITTFGGNPVCCAAGNAALQVLQQSNWIHEVAVKEQFLLDQLVHPSILNHTHKGLWMSLQFSSSVLAKKVAACCVANGIITDWFLFAEDKIRIAPPLSSTMEELSEAVNKIKASIEEAVASN